MGKLGKILGKLVKILGRNLVQELFAGLSDADCTGQTQGTQEMGVVTAPPTALTSDVVVVIVAVGGVVVVLQLVILVAAVMVCAYRRWRPKSIRFVLMQRVGEGGGEGGGGSRVMGSEDGRGIVLHPPGKGLGLLLLCTAWDVDISL